MTDRQLFGALVRVFGLVFVFEAVSNVNVGIAQLLEPGITHKYPAHFDLIFAAIEILVALGFIRWADRVVHLAYRSRSDSN